MNDHDAIIVGGGQAGLAAAHALRTRGLRPVILEAGAEPVGSWPRYYDSLTLFSPARYSSLPGLAFPGDPERYPRRDEVVDYLRRYASCLDTDIRTGHHVETVTHDDGVFAVHAAGEAALTAPILIAASGGFSRPFRPELPGMDTFTGTLLHSSEYRSPGSFAGQRVVVVGAGNSAVQIATELAAHARVTLATRAPVKFAPQRPFGKDVHFWSAAVGFDHLPIGHLLKKPLTSPVNDPGIYTTAIRQGRPDQRRMFTTIDGDTVVWPDGTREHVDTILLATGFRPGLSYLDGLGALARDDRPLHDRGLSTTHPGLAYVGLEWQRSFASATLRGVGRDAHYVTTRLLPTGSSPRAKCCQPAPAR
ncbi:flavin-containing monooxygenase [Amycolatopsis keratiniphila]|uniref:flavin-containing monooxygenase n=1 Tax=Amycolatopsis keratiniphila TaxID=129921 RepID=UPI00087B0565|nr:NAD(P)-binding domain-containing protein [Amycolatopsis keratiniphila]OLZ45982.1 FAD-dependent oxidoreductase [Amycolatopsis keratiniphila subsp. nogabecina]SDU11841.1 putative flavoprotein involved in K+ transport [Amycolatopsis keratiniphila]